MTHISFLFSRIYRMQISCYHYHSNRLSKIFTFIKDGDIINMYLGFIFGLDEDDVCYPFVMTEEKLKSFPVLYQSYIISLFMTKDTKKLYEYNDGYGIQKKKIWKGMRITQEYDMLYTYMEEYPKMSYTLDTDDYINNHMFAVQEYLNINNNHFYFSKLLDQELDKIETELIQYEKEIKDITISYQFLKKVIPKDFSKDLQDLIFKNILI